MEFENVIRTSFNSIIEPESGHSSCLIQNVTRSVHEVKLQHEDTLSSDNHLTKQWQRVKIPDNHVRVGPSESKWIH